MRCRSPKFPAGGIADCLVVTETIGQMTGICPDCECMMNRRISIARVAQVRGKLEIRFTKAQEHTPSRLVSRTSRISSRRARKAL